jgi:multiple sugar transport system permease protein
MSTNTLRDTTLAEAPALPESKRRYQADRRSLPLTLMMGAFLVYFFLPLFWLVVSSTKNNADLFSSFGLWFSGSFNLFANIKEVFTFNGGVYGQWLLNTTYYAVVSAGGASIFAAMGGYAMAKLNFPGRNLMFAIVLGSIMVPATALAIPTYLLLSHIGLIDTPLAVILPSLVSPFGLYLMKVYAEVSVPDSLLEAARIDGAGEFRIFWRIAFRQMAPGFVTVLLFTLVATWNNYFLPLVMLSTPKYYPVTVGLASWNSQANAGGGSQALFSLVVTGSLISIIPLTIAFLMLQRYWQSGLGVGGVKA